MIKRLKDIDNRIYIQENIHSGEYLYYLDENFIIPFEGIIYSEFNNYLEFEFEVINGKKQGLEYIYYKNGVLEQINECNGNLIYGISKEFTDNGILKTVSIVFCNYFIKVIYLDQNKNITKIINDYSENLLKNKNIIDRINKNEHNIIKKLLELSNEEIINYTFTPKFLSNDISN